MLQSYFIAHIVFFNVDAQTESLYLFIEKTYLLWLSIHESNCWPFRISRDQNTLFPKSLENRQQQAKHTDKTLLIYASFPVELSYLGLL